MGFPFWPFGKKKEEKVESKPVVAETPDPEPVEVFEKPKVAVKAMAEKRKAEFPTDTASRISLTSDEKLEMCRMIAAFVRPVEIVEHFRTVIGKEISAPSVNNYKNSDKWKPLIDKYRDEYTKGVMDVPISHKRKRLEELQDIYDKQKDKGKLKEAQSVLSDARSEMEERRGDVSFHLTQINHTEFHDMSDEQLLDEKAKALEQLSKIKKLKEDVRNGKIIQVSGEEVREISEEDA